jgi:hypothetical protein
MAYQRTLFYKFDPSGTTLTYGRFLDEFNLKGFIKTSGSSTTTTAVEATGEGSHPFDVVTPQVAGVGGDWLRTVDNAGTELLRNVTAKASSSSITVDSAWDLSAGVHATCLPFRFGTAASDGWAMAASTNKVTIKINVLAVASGSVTVAVEGRMSDTDATAYTIFSKAYTTATSDIVTITEPWTFIRVGVKETSGAGTDSISVYLVSEDTVEV